jgi:small GTP-binding protein
MRWATGSYHGSVPSTIGANHHRKTLTIEDQEVDFYVWDTAGQEQYQALTPLYSRTAAAAIIVASTDDLPSFTAIDSWIHVLETSCEKFPPVILAVNKIDLPTTVLPQDDIEKRHRSKVTEIFYVSAVTGECIDTLFTAAAHAAYEFTIRSAGSRPGRNLGGDSNNGGCC